MNVYKNSRFYFGLCALAGGAAMLAFGLRGDTSFLMIGILGIVTGAWTMMNLSKKNK